MISPVGGNTGRRVVGGRHDPDSVASPERARVGALDHEIPLAHRPAPIHDMSARAATAEESGDGSPGSNTVHRPFPRPALPHDASRSDTGRTRRAEKVPVRLVKKARAGNLRAFETLWRRYAPSVQGILLTMLNDADAEDLTQEVAMAALRALPSLRDPSTFPAWLCTIARNVGRDALKTQRARSFAPLNAADDVPAPAAGDSLEAEEILWQIRALPEAYREPLMLRLLLEMTGPEIAARTGMTPGSVRVNLCRGMKLLRRRLAECGMEEAS